MTNIAELEEVEEFAYEHAGNWRKFSSFAWFNQPEDALNWAIFYTHNRDSGTVDRSNAEIIRQRMEPFTEGEDPDAIAEEHNHWAVGWVAGHAIRCLKGGEVTEAIAEWSRIQDELAEYPILDEDHLSNLEHTETVEALWRDVDLAMERGERTEKPLPETESWIDTVASEVYEWISENDSGELENRDGQGAIVSDEAIANALIELGYLMPEERE
jgi:hypothetical protein